MDQSINKRLYIDVFCGYTYDLWSGLSFNAVALYEFSEAGQRPLTVEVAHL